MLSEALKLPEDARIKATLRYARSRDDKAFWRTYVEPYSDDFIGFVNAILSNYPELGRNRHFCPPTPAKDTTSDEIPAPAPTETFTPEPITFIPAPTPDEEPAHVIETKPDDGLLEPAEEPTSEEASAAPLITHASYPEDDIHILCNTEEDTCQIQDEITEDIYTTGELTSLEYEKDTSAQEDTPEEDIHGHIAILPDDSSIHASDSHSNFTTPKDLPSTPVQLASPIDLINFAPCIHIKKIYSPMSAFVSCTPHLWTSCTQRIVQPLPALSTRTRRRRRQMIIHGRYRCRKKKDEDFSRSSHAPCPRHLHHLPQPPRPSHLRLSIDNSGCARDTLLNVSLASFVRCEVLFDERHIFVDAATVNNVPHPSSFPSICHCLSVLTYALIRFFLGFRRFSMFCNPACIVSSPRAHDMGSQHPTSSSTSSRSLTASVVPFQHMQAHLSTISTIFRFFFSEIHHSRLTTTHSVAQRLSTPPVVYQVPHHIITSHFDDFLMFSRVLASCSLFFNNSHPTAFVMTPSTHRQLYTPPNRLSETLQCFSKPFNSFLEKNIVLLLLPERKLDLLNYVLSGSFAFFHLDATRRQLSDDATFERFG